MGQAHTAGGPAEADHRLWEPPRDSPVPPLGATNRRPATEVVLQRNPPPFREDARQLVTPPGANPGVPARQAQPTRRPRGTQHPHGCQLPHHPDPLTTDVQRRGIPRPDPVNTHTHTKQRTTTKRHKCVPPSASNVPSTYLCTQPLQKRWPPLHCMVSSQKLPYVMQ